MRKRAAVTAARFVFQAVFENQLAAEVFSPLQAFLSCRSNGRLILKPDISYILLSHRITQNRLFYLIVFLFNGDIMTISQMKGFAGANSLYKYCVCWNRIDFFHLQTSLLENLLFRVRRQFTI